MNAKNLVELMRAIDCLDLNELRQVSDAVRARWNELNAEKREEFKVNDRVRFHAGRRRGGLVFGTVLGQKGKSIIVQGDGFGGRKWRVSPTLLVHLTNEIGGKR